MRLAISVGVSDGNPAFGSPSGGAAGNGSRHFFGLLEEEPLQRTIASRFRVVKGRGFNAGEYIDAVSDALGGLAKMCVVQSAA